MIEVSYKLIKSFLIFTSSRSWLFRFFIFVLAMLIYTLYLLLKGVTSKEAPHASSLTDLKFANVGGLPLTTNYLAFIR
ncbi:MAG: hypothetical protein QXV69_07995 [Sulfolobaceae archaeon]